MALYKNDNGTLELIAGRNLSTLYADKAGTLTSVGDDLFTLYPSSGVYSSGNTGTATTTNKRFIWVERLANGTTTVQDTISTWLPIVALQANMTVRVNGTDVLTITAKSSTSISFTANTYCRFILF